MNSYHSLSGQMETKRSNATRGALSTGSGSRFGARSPAFKAGLRAIPQFFFLILLTLGIMTGCSSSDSATAPQADPLTDAEWIAFRDGDGAWQEIELPASKVFDFTDAGGDTFVTDPDGRYTLVSVRATASNQQVEVFTLQSTTGEASQLDFSAFFPGDEQASLQVTVSGIESDTRADLYLGNEDIGLGVNGTFTFTDSAGTYDLVATRSSLGSDLPTLLAARRDLVLQAGLTTSENVDFTATGADAPLALTDQYTVSVNSAHPLDYGEVFLLTANGTAASLGYESWSGSVAVAYMAVPSGGLAAGDHYMTRLSLEPDDDSYITYYEGFASAGDRTVTPPGVFDGVSASDTSTGYLLPGLTGSTFPDAIGYTIQYRASGSTIDYYFNCHISTGWLDGTSGSVAFTMPDMHAVAGWESKWSIPLDADMVWAYASAQAGSAGVSLTEFMQWYLIGAPRVEQGEWFASSVNSDFGDSGEPMHLR